MKVLLELLYLNVHFNMFGGAMERNVRYISIGIVFFAIVIGFVFFVLWLGRFDFNSSGSSTYYIYTQDEVSNIGVNTPVKFKGIGVGKVSDVRFENYNTGLVKITLTIDSGLEVREDSYLSVGSGGLAGANYLALSQGESANLNTTKILELKKGGLDVLLQKVEDIGDRTASLMTSLTNEENLKNLNEILANLSKISKDIAQATNKLDSITHRVDNNFKNGQYDLRAIISPTMLQLESSLLEMDNFFAKATRLVDKIEQSPYDSIFGKRKESKD